MTTSDITDPDWTTNRRDTAWTCPDQTGEALEFHRSLDGYAPTALIELPELAVELGVGRVFAKDESTRLGLPAFKALGASWAVHRALGRAGSEEGATSAEVITATDGNHGRAVARFARLAGRAARIFVPAAGIHPDAVAAIRGEGAEVVEHAGNYDETVVAAARFATDSGGVLVQDTAWDGYEEVPGWIVEGYSTLFQEIDAQLADGGRRGPDLVLVPTGVGSLLQAGLAHYRSESGPRGTAVVSVEPESAACMGPSLTAGHPVTVETGQTIMSGLNCGTPSSLAWPFIREGLDASAAVGEQETIAAAHRLAELGVAAGPCGAASLAGALLALTGDGAQSRRADLGVGPESIIVLTVTEGSDANPVPAG
ncbi:diaminopropionate ammonia-lyase [Brevibacterium marinum]|uniref:Diaminopropionate ammonia-lyase n=1 Tax=Brevibacterium marinum TaxID=418643 RepID=A0A846RW36_9MICO|nr:diaminopropionate ammonia-lyase [Brevibacterium marinum]NJC55270.1 diaminopropionate ammonia-lyase [Brevibacterium marinum]